MPGGPSKAIAVTTSAPTTGSVQLGGPVGGLVSVQVYSPTGNNAWMGYGVDAATAIANSVIPVPGTPRSCIPVPSGALFTVTLPAGTYINGISLVGGQTFYITPGQGV